MNKKLFGLLTFLLFLYLALWYADPSARSWDNHYNLARRIGQYGLISLGAGLLIIAGGIDLSIGSVIGLSATVLVVLLEHNRSWGLPGHVLIVAVVLFGALLGCIHGVLVTGLRVQPFVVTLCGLFIYRGAARWLAADQVKGLGNDYPDLKAFYYLNDVFGLPRFFVIFLLVSAAAAVFLHLSVYGRYLFAIGSNERAARYSGIATDRYKIVAYMLCSTSAAFFGCLYLMEQNSVQPSAAGNFMELYAIAGAVLGGCSLRGGEGNVLGIMIGTTILVMLPNFANMWGVPNELQYTVIGGALLLGACVDELLQRVEHSDTRAV
ncbi:MAG: sugar ABC transporter permease [Gemmataceae bacterium]